MLSKNYTRNFRILIFYFRHMPSKFKRDQSMEGCQIRMSQSIERCLRIGVIETEIGDLSKNAVRIWKSLEKSRSILI